MSLIKNADLLMNADGSVYHLAIRPGQLADHVLIVGDPDRVTEISDHFDRIETRTRNREFVSHTGYLNGTRITALSTGIGTDNIDIVMNELDALVNIDMVSRQIKQDHHVLNVIRIGTSGSIQPDIPVGAFALSSCGMGLDNLLYFYHSGKDLLDHRLAEAFMNHASWNGLLSKPYFIRGSEELIRRFENGTVKGITATAPGFYGPQGRILRIGLADPGMNEKMQTFRYNDERIINFEMETSALYGLGRLLGHHVMTVCALIANRATNETCTDHKSVIRKLIGFVLERITSQEK